MNSNFPSALIFASLLTIILTSCGGGDASKTSTDNNLPSPVPGGINGEVVVPGPTGESPVPPATLDSLPKVFVGQRQFADPNVLLNLQGTAEAATGAHIVKTLWTQVTGPTVIIPSPQSLNNVIVVPDVSIATQLEFRLTAQDSEDRINSATVSILVKPVPTFVKVIGGVFNEADERAVFKIRLNAPSTNPITVSYLTQDGTAHSLVSETRDDIVDYVANSGEIVFAAGEVLKEVSVTLINDALKESDETFSLQVTAVDGAATHANTGVAIIRDGTEPQLAQKIQFADEGPINIYVGEERNNSVVPDTQNIIYSSSNSSVASVNPQGVVAAVSVGTATITATKPADGIYLSASNSYTVNVLSRGTAPSVSLVRTASTTLFEPQITEGGYGVFSNDAAGVLKYSLGAIGNEGSIGEVVETYLVVAVDGQEFLVDVSITVGADGPSAKIDDSAIKRFLSRTNVDGYSVPSGGSVKLTGQASDLEDGPVTSLSWSSSIDGFLGNGELLDTNQLTQGTHIITYSATDSDGNTSTASARVLVGNIAPSAYYAVGSSTFCSEGSVSDCYSSERVNDTSLSTELGGEHSWTNDNGGENGLPQWVTLGWTLPATIHRIDIYTTEGYIVRDYDIEYNQNGEEGWLPLVSVTDNTETFRSHDLPIFVAYNLRVVVKKGPSNQPQFGRINEIVVFGTKPSIATGG